MADHHLILTDAQLELVLIGLRAISPSGGGSAPFTLYRQIAQKHRGEVSIRHEQRAQLSVLQELQTYMSENPEATLDGMLSDLRTSLASGDDDAN